MRKPVNHRLRTAAGCGLVLSLLNPVAALAFDRHDFTTTASTAGTTAYIVGKHAHDDLAAAHRFERSQRVAVQREAAAGGGEDVRSLGALLGVADPVAFGGWMQQHYSTLYDPGRDRSTLVDRIIALRPA